MVMDADSSGENNSLINHNYAHFAMKVAAATVCLAAVSGYFFSSGRQAQKREDMSARTAGFVQTSDIESELSLQGKSENPLNEKIREAYKIMAREEVDDGIITAQEKRAFLKKLGIEEVIDEVEAVSLSANKEEPRTFDVYFNTPYRNRSIVKDTPLGFVKNLPGESLLKYIASAPPRKK